ncbi:MAG: hypothetical protein HY770_07900 [Chitinivibrionia bacterium]|nr:hypothetical protein [Chitinivibrionia bacterium]
MTRRRHQKKMRQTFIWPLVKDAREVCIAGDFNAWTPLPMTRLYDCFQTVVDLAPGEYQYKFIVDGEWKLDPSTEEEIHNELGAANSIIRVR